MEKKVAGPSPPVQQGKPNQGMPSRSPETEPIFGATRNRRVILLPEKSEEASKGAILSAEGFKFLERNTVLHIASSAWDRLAVKLTAIALPVIAPFVQIGLDSKMDLTPYNYFAQFFDNASKLMQGIQHSVVEIGVGLAGAVAAVGLMVPFLSDKKTENEISREQSHEDPQLRESHSKKRGWNTAYRVLSKFRNASLLASAALVAQDVFFSSFRGLSSWSQASLAAFGAFFLAAWGASSKEEKYSRKAAEAEQRHAQPLEEAREPKEKEPPQVAEGLAERTTKGPSGSEFLLSGNLNLYDPEHVAKAKYELTRCISNGQFRTVTEFQRRYSSSGLAFSNWFYPFMKAELGMRSFSGDPNGAIKLGDALGIRSQDAERHLLAKAIYDENSGEISRLQKRFGITDVSEMRDAISSAVSMHVDNGNHRKAKEIARGYGWPSLYEEALPAADEGPPGNIFEELWDKFIGED